MGNLAKAIDKAKDIEILGILLEGGCANSKTAEILVNKLGNLREVIFTPEMELIHIEGIDSDTITRLKILKEMISRITVQTLRKKTLIKAAQDVSNYYRNLLGQEKKEQLRIMFLNNEYKLITESLIQNGTTTELPFYIREIVQKSLDYGAAFIVLVHNHPSGKVKPSQQDIDETSRLKFIVELLGIRLWDHLIVSENNTFSFKKHSLL